MDVRKLLKQILMLSVITIFSMSCYEIEKTSDPINPDEITGQYTAGFGLKENDYLLLQEDSTFIHYFKTLSGKLYIDTGFWEYSASPKYRHYTVVLNNFIMRYPQINGCFSNSESAGIDTLATRLVLNLYKHETSISIKFCPSRNQFYTKNY